MSKFDLTETVRQKSGAVAAGAPTGDSAGVRAAAEGAGDTAADAAPSGPTLAITEEEWIAASQACCGANSEPSPVHAGLAETLSRCDVNEFAASVRVSAVKPRD